MLRLKLNKNNLIFLFILLVLSIPSILPLFNPGFFRSDDGEWMIIRFSAFHQAFRDGQFPVRFLGRLNYGYGYPVSNFLYPGFMYLAEPIHLLGVNFVNTIKVIVGFSLITSSVFTYFWLSKLFNKASALIGALFYLYVPYHLYDLYMRGSAGEILALAVLPFILWQLERKSLFWLVIGLGLLIISHNTLALLFLPIVICYMILNILTNYNKKTLIYNYIGTLILGLGISAFFWLPAIFELQYTNFYKIAVSNFNEYFSDLSLIGLSTIVVFILITVLFITKKINIRKHRLTVLLFIIGITSLFFSTSLSYSFWNILPVSFIQFPFRLLSVTILCASFLVACAISVLPKKLQIITSIIILFTMFIAAKPFLTPSQSFDKGDFFYSTNEGTTTVKDEYLPKWVKNRPIEHFKNKIEITKGQGQISDPTYNSKEILFNVSSNENLNLRINTIYYPGWELFVDNVQSTIDYSNEMGVMDFLVEEGKHNVKLIFSETFIRMFADFLSIFSLIFLIIIIFPKKVFKKILL